MKNTEISSGPVESGHVVLLHGLAPVNPIAHIPIQRYLQHRGYAVTYAPYDSVKHDIPTLVERFLVPRVARILDNSAVDEPIHFVSYSMGGLLVRQYLAHHSIPQLGRAVMVAPPNRGTPVVDKLGHLSLFGWLFGPGAREMGTGPLSRPRQLGAVSFELGVIAGTVSINPLFSAWMEGQDDGTVPVSSTRVEGMKAHIRVRATHPFIFSHREVMRQTAYFLQRGSFQPSPRVQFSELKEASSAIAVA